MVSASVIAEALAETSSVRSVDSFISALGIHGSQVSDAHHPDATRPSQMQREGKL